MRAEPTSTAALPELLDVRALRDELGVTRAAAEAIVRALGLSSSKGCARPT